MIKFLTSSVFDTATLTAKSEASTAYAASNIQNKMLKKTWRSTGVANEWLKFDTGGATAITLITFFNSNLTSSATVKLYGHATDLGDTEAAWAGATYSATCSNFDTRAGALVLNQSLRWWLFAISDVTNPQGYIEVGRIVAGPSTIPTDNISQNLSERETDPSDIMFTQGQSLYSTQRLRFKEFSFEFNDISRTDQVTLRTIWAAVRKTEPLVIAFDTDVEPVELTRYGVLTSDLNFTYSPNNRANCSMSFRELR